MSKNKNSDEFLLFMHIPKTAGQSLRGVIKKQYDLEETYRCPFMEEKVIELSEEFRNSLKFIYGHFLFGTHEYFPKPFTYISMMRNPVERFISAYYHIIRVPTNRMHDKVKHMSLEEFIDSDDFNLQAEPNIQTRFFCGKEPLSLETAKKNMAKHFSVVGITELFEESLFLMKKQFGWDDIQYRTKNAATNRPKKKKVSQEVIDKIAAKNHLDIKLYNYARNEFENKIQALDPETRKEIEEFKKSLGKMKTGIKKGKTK